MCSSFKIPLCPQRYISRNSRIIGDTVLHYILCFQSGGLRWVSSRLSASSAPSWMTDSNSQGAHHMVPSQGYCMPGSTGVGCTAPSLSFVFLPLLSLTIRAALHSPHYTKKTEDPPHTKESSPETPVLSRKAGGNLGLLLKMGNNTVPSYTSSHLIPPHFLAASQKTTCPVCFPHFQNFSFLNYGEDSMRSHRCGTYHLMWYFAVTAPGFIHPQCETTALRMEGHSGTAQKWPGPCIWGQLWKQNIQGVRILS